MMLMERYQKAVEELLAKVRATQTETIQKAGQIIADSVANGGKVYLAEICHSIQMDLIYRGGGPIFYKQFKKDEHWESLKAGDVLVVSSVSGRTQHVVDMAWEAMERGVTVIAFTSMEYATQVDPVAKSCMNSSRWLWITAHLLPKLCWKWMGSKPVLRRLPGSHPTILCGISLPVWWKICWQRASPPVSSRAQTSPAVRISIRPSWNPTMTSTAGKLTCRTVQTNAMICKELSVSGTALFPVMSLFRRC